MIVEAPLEETANDLEMLCGQAISPTSDIIRRIKLERSDAARAALEEAAKKIESQDGGLTYQKAFKASAALLRRLKAAL
ncbi:MAG: hypothetical protein JWL86_795 [Rhizobium sp.]|nr:hypothetical protein [Rhizobium sp.]